MTQQPKRRRRCQLAVPADSWRKIEKAAASGVDHVFLDLEDAVAPDNKPQARQNVIKAFNELDWGTTVRCFRMNGLDCEWAYQDLIEVIEGCGHNVDTVLVPKVKAPRDVHFVENLLEQLEWKIGRKGPPIGIEMLIEEVEGAAYCTDIATASDRVECLIFGVGDYTRAQGVDIRDAFGKPRNYPGDLWHHVRGTIVVAARTAGADYVDGPWGLIPDQDGYRRECKMVKTLGGVGKWAIHPSQIPIAMEEFGPSGEEISMATNLLEQFKVAKAEGKGAIKTPDGALLDEAAIPLLQQILDQADFYGIAREAAE